MVPLLVFAIRQKRTFFLRPAKRCNVRTDVAALQLYAICNLPRNIACIHRYHRSSVGKRKKKKKKFEKRMFTIESRHSMSVWLSIALTNEAAASWVSDQKEKKKRLRPFFYLCEYANAIDRQPESRNWHMRGQWLTIDHDDQLYFEERVVARDPHFASADEISATLWLSFRLL